MNKELSPKTPNYRLRQFLAGTAAMGMALTGAELFNGGVSATYDTVRGNITNPGKAAFEQHDCTLDGATTEVIGPDETVWFEVTAPLAEDLNISGDEASLIVGYANKDSTSNTTAFTVPVCK